MDGMKLAYMMALKAHDGQVDKAGRPYIEHVLAVSRACPTDDAKIVGMLHDVIEDGDGRITLDAIRDAFGDRVADAVKALTHAKGSDYMAYVEKLKKNPLAVSVKLADLKHNMDLGRLPEITDKDLDRHAKYVRAKALLLAS